MATYSCPMHPEVQSKSPGICPKCGMKLERSDGIEREASARPDPENPERRK